MCKYLNSGMIKRIWSNARREGDFSKLLCTNIGLILIFFLVPYFANSWLWKIIICVFINIGYIVIRAVLIELNIINIANKNQIGSNGEITFPVSQISDAKTSVIIILEHGLYTVKESYNVSSITDYGYGDIGVNFVSPFKDTNFTCNVSGDESLEWKLADKSASSVRINFKKEPSFFKVQITE